jgi:hypothetical protein
LRGRIRRGMPIHKIASRGRGRCCPITGHQLAVCGWNLPPVKAVVLMVGTRGLAYPRSPALVCLGAVSLCLWQCPNLKIRRARHKKCSMQQKYRSTHRRRRRAWGPLRPRQRMRLIQQSGQPQRLSSRQGVTQGWAFGGAGGCVAAGQGGAPFWPPGVPATPSTPCRERAANS